MAPTNDQIQTVAREWAAADHEKFVKVLYEKLFAAHPEYASLFPKFKAPVSLDQPGFVKQVKAVAASLDKVMNLAKAGDKDQLMEALHATAKRHEGYKVYQEHFQALKPILGDILEGSIPRADKAAWSETFGFILDNCTPA